MAERGEASGTASEEHPGPMSGGVPTRTKKGVWRKSKTIENMSSDDRQGAPKRVVRWENRGNKQPHAPRIYARLGQYALKGRRQGEKTRKLMKEYLQDSKFNLQNRDTTGNSPLLLAVKTDNPEAVDRHLNRASPALAREALLLSISLDLHHISASIIRHHNYCALPDDAVCGTLTSEVSETSLDGTGDDTLFAADITPLVLAAQRNQFQIVKLLISEGESIEEPHSYNCNCKNCRGAQSFDELRFAKTRLSIYKGLASAAYLSLSSPDPILATFRLIRILKHNAEIEKHFKGEYKQLTKQLGDYTVKLLDKVRDGEELDILLNESRGTPFSDLGKMARLKLAIRYEGKLFVAHASCQKKITHIWYGNMAGLQDMHPLALMLWVLGFFIAYPFLALTFWIYPFGKLKKFLSTPVIKFMADVLSHLFLVILILLYSINEYGSEGDLLSEKSGIDTKYSWYRDECNRSATCTPAIEDVFLRSNSFGLTAYLLGVMVAGYVWQIMKNMSLEKLHFFTDNWFNTLDLVTFGLYCGSLLLRGITVIMVDQAFNHFSKSSSWIDLLRSNGSDDDGHLYWLDADRTQWKEYDLFIVSEAMIALAHVMCIARTASMLTATRSLGPLIIVLREMIKNVMVFMAIFLIVIFAFMVGFNSLYWYYDDKIRGKAERNPTADDIPAQENFGKVLYIARTIFFAIFGVMEPKDVEIGAGYKYSLTTTVGYILLGAYCWISIIILINMLIAMMARSYLYIEADKDVEWKFSRTKLYLEYIKEGNIVCVPFNLIPSIWGFLELIKDIGTCCGCRNPSDAGRKKREKQKQKQQMKFRNESFEGDDVQQGEVQPSGSSSAKDSFSEGTKPVVDKTQSSPEKNGKNKIPEHYRRVIEKIVQRFIVHNSTKKPTSSGGSLDDTGGTLATLKQDLSSFRYEVMKSIKSQEEEKAHLQETVASLETNLKETGKYVEEVATTCVSLEQILVGEVRENLMQTNEKLEAMEERVKYVRQDAHNYEANIGLRLKNMESNFGVELSRLKSLSATLTDMDKTLNEVATEMKGLKSQIGSE